MTALVLLVPVPSLAVWLAMWFEPTRGTALGSSLYMAGKIWLLLFPLVWHVAVCRRPIGFSPPRLGGLWTGLGMGAGLAGITLLGYWLVGRDLIDASLIRAQAEENGLIDPAVYLGFACYISLVNALAEEYQWRWFVYEQCRPLFRGGRAIFATALFFTLHHVLALKAQFGWLVTILGSFGVLSAGLLWSWLYHRFQSVWPGYLSHVLADIAIFAIGWDLLFGW